MKNNILLCACMLFFLSGLSQQISTSVGRVSTIFNYLNSADEEIENLHSINAFHYSLGYRLTLSDRIYISSSLVYNNYSKEGSDAELDNYYKWNTKYLGLSISPQYEILQSQKLRMLVQADVSPQFLLNGQQTINNQIFDLKGIEQFDSPFIFLRAGLALNYCLDEKVGISLGYFYGQGSPFSKSEDGEQLKIRTGTISIGLLWSLKTCKYCQNRRTNR